MGEQIRKSVIAGSWYPGNSRALRAMIESFLENVVQDEIEGEIAGLVAPHAGYVYSGQTAAFAYKTIMERRYDCVIVISPSHRTYFSGVSVYPTGGYETPLGVVPVDEEIASLLLSESSEIKDIPAAHAQEHALEIQLPFLQVVLGEFSFVPLVMGNQDRKTCEELAHAITKVVGNKKILIVGSSDLSHFHPHERAKQMDGVVLGHLENMDAEGLLNDLASGKCEACGGGPSVVTMLAASKLGADRSRMLKYADSGEITGDRSSVVGYASAVFYKGRI